VPPRPRRSSPSLAAGEIVIVRATIADEDALLTNRRVVIAGRDSEQSLPLAHIALARVRFERTARQVVIGFALILLAVILFVIASPLRSFFLNQSVALESAARDERAAAVEGPRIAQGLQRMLTQLATGATWIPALGWIVLAFGVANIALGVIGRTVVTIAAGGTEVTFAKRGNDRALHEFIAEVGQHLSALRS
jgi:hypothetical protein